MAFIPTHKEQIHHEYFDTLVRGVGASVVGTNTQLFGPANIGAPALTNMQEGGRLSNNEVFLTLSIRIYVQFADAALYRFMEDGVIWTYRVGHKPMLESLPLLCAPAGGGMYGYDVNAQAHIVGNGSPNWAGVLRFAKPITIESNQHFAVAMEFHDFASLDGVTPLIAPRTQLNNNTGLKIVKVFVGGVVERQVQ